MSGEGHVKFGSSVVPTFLQPEDAMPIPAELKDVKDLFTKT